jgi:hypothetical protein
MKLIPYFEVTGYSSYPDDYTLFSNMSKVNFNSTDYWLCDYAGTLDLETGPDTYEDYVESLGPEVTYEQPKITKRAFMKRFTLAERISIRNSTDDVIIDVYEDLKLASYVELDTQDVSDALIYMVSVGILESSRVDEMLVDGTELEAYP